MANCRFMATLVQEQEQNNLEDSRFAQSNSQCLFTKYIKEITTFNVTTFNLTFSFNYSKTQKYISINISLCSKRIDFVTTNM